MARALLTVWTLWAHFSGIFVISVGLAFALVQSFERSGPVSIHSEQKVITPQAVVGRSLIYEVRVDRRESCPGRIVEYFQRTDGPNREQIVSTRPIVTTQVAVTPKLRIAVILPGLITVGRWHYKAALVSDCPTRKREDIIIEADFDVVSP